MKIQPMVVALVAIATLSVSMQTQAGFDAFVIREAGGNPPGILANNVYVPGATEFVISAGGMKAALGSNDINGATIAQIAELSITRHDDTTRFAAGSGPAVAPYFNVWVTDGGGNYAVIANEPSNPAFQPLFTSNLDGSKTYELSYADIQGTAAKVYETPGWNTNSSWVHALVGNDPLTFADVAGLAIAPPSVAYIQNGANAVGSGAPDVLGTQVAYGFNWVFGDTLANYVSGNEGYVVSDFQAAAVPEPTAIVLGGLGLALLASGRRR
jgi:hypothetical protein